MQRRRVARETPALLSLRTHHHHLEMPESIGERRRSPDLERSYFMTHELTCTEPQDHRSLKTLVEDAPQAAFRFPKRAF